METEYTKLRRQGKAVQPCIMCFGSGLFVPDVGVSQDLCHFCKGTGLAPSFENSATLKEITERHSSYKAEESLKTQLLKELLALVKSVNAPAAKQSMG
jgi:hypothetical protein